MSEEIPSHGEYVSDGEFEPESKDSVKGSLEGHNADDANSEGDQAEEETDEVPGFNEDAIHWPIFCMTQVPNEVRIKTTL